MVSTHLTGATAYDLGGTLSGGQERGTVCKVVSGEAPCYGYNGQGQLGDGTTTSSLSPVTVKYDNDPDEDDVNLVPLTGVTAVAVGGDHACAIVGGGQVWCWGANNAGQLGDNTTDARVGAVKVQNDDDSDDDNPLTGATASPRATATPARSSAEARCTAGAPPAPVSSAAPGPASTRTRPSDAPGGDLARATDIVTGDNHTCVVQAGEATPTTRRCSAGARTTRTSSASPEATATPPGRARDA